MSRWTENDSTSHSWSAKTPHQTGWSGIGEIRGPQETEAGGTGGMSLFSIVIRVKTDYALCLGG